MLRIIPRDINSEFDKKRVIRDPNPLDSEFKSFNSDGIFSPEIFGNMNNGDDYICGCDPKDSSALRGKFNNGVTCKKCNTKVEYRGLMIQKEGWIELQNQLIHPYFFNFIRKIIGGTNLLNILTFTGDIEVGGKLIEPELKPPYTGIGIVRFRENFLEILDYFFKKSDKRKTSKDYKFIVENRDILFVRYYPIINVKLRPAMIVNDKFSFEEINNLYNQIIANSNLMRTFSKIERNPLNIEPLCLKNQMLLMEIFEEITKNLSKKEGYIRCTLLGNRVNWSSRMVIIPLPIGYDADNCIIPYNTALEMTKPLLLKRYSQLKGISLIDANDIFIKAHSKFNPIIYEMAKEIVTSDNFGLLINRNPTINLGSIMLLKVVDVKKDIGDKTASISNMILTPLGADFDGDVLNFIALFGREFIELFEKFRPYNMTIDYDSGLFNDKFMPFKDSILGISTLFNMRERHIKRRNKK